MAAEFVAEEGLLKGLILSLEEGEQWVVGRDPDQSDIVIEDPKSSRRAFLCRKTDNGYFVENLSTTNPILVNDLPITGPTLLEEGDRIAVGSSVFRFYLKVRSSFFFEPEGREPFEEAFTEEEEFPEEEKFKALREEEKEAEPKEVFEESLEEVTPEDRPRETIYEETELPEFAIDLTPEARFLLKVIAGPNTGAEFALEMGKTYLIGTDTVTCDIIFNDLSVSKEHARLSVSKDGIVTIEDLNSRNGVVVDRSRIAGRAGLDANSVVVLGTSAFLLIDREAPAETIAAQVFEAPYEEEKVEEEKVTPKLALPKPAKKPVSFGAFILSLFIAGLAVLLGVALVSLFKSEEVETVQYDYQADIQNIMKDFPGVRYTYNKANQKLFLMGHVLTGVQHNELNYRLRSLNFIKGIEDNVVNDEAIWQDMNILLSKHPDFKGVSMHSPEPGVFVLTGYLQTDQQAADLSDYINIHFNYLSLLQNRVVVEEQVIEEVGSSLLQRGFGAVNVAFSNGELLLTGYVSSTQTVEFEKLLDDYKKIPGVRSLKNFVVAVSPEQGVIDLNKRYPGRYRVTGYSKHGDMNINVVINGIILSRGDLVDGMTITSIQPHAIFLEKEGLKYKIEYNK